MSKVNPEIPRVDIDFTDARLTNQGGLTFLARLADQLNLPARFAESIRIKQRRRGASDAEMLWSLVASLAAGNGALSDLDALRSQPVDQALLGLEEVPSGRRLGEYLSRFQEQDIEASYGQFLCTGG